MDQQRHAHLAQQRGGLPGPVGGVGRDAGVRRPPGLHRGGQRAHRLLERRLRVEPVAVEDVDVVEAHPGQALVERAEEVLARPPLAVGPRPHVVAGLGRDHQLVAVGAEVLGEDRAEVRLRRAVGRPVVVGQVEVGDPAVEGPAQDRPLGLDRLVVAEVVPQPERDRGQLQPGAAAASVGVARRSGRRRRGRAAGSCRHVYRLAGTGQLSGCPRIADSFS